MPYGLSGLSRLAFVVAGFLAAALNLSSYVVAHPGHSHEESRRGSNANIELTWLPREWVAADSSFHDNGVFVIAENGTVQIRHEDDSIASYDINTLRSQDQLWIQLRLLMLRESLAAHFAPSVKSVPLLSSGTPATVEWPSPSPVRHAAKSRGHDASVGLRISSDEHSESSVNVSKPIRVTDSRFGAIDRFGGHFGRSGDYHFHLANGDEVGLSAVLMAGANVVDGLSVQRFAESSPGLVQMTYSLHGVAGTATYRLLEHGGVEFIIADSQQRKFSERNCPVRRRVSRQNVTLPNASHLDR